MPESLTVARFSALAEAYGPIAHWPEELREDARRMALLPEVAGILAQAKALDDQLDRWKVDGPSSALTARILGRRKTSLAQRARLWWSAIGLATALAGAASGAFVATSIPVVYQPHGDETVFGDVLVQDD